MASVIAERPTDEQVWHWVDAHAIPHSLPIRELFDQRFMRFKGENPAEHQLYREMIDRLAFGHVRDFVHFHVDSVGFNWAIFNVADVMLVCGACTLVLFALRPEPAPQDAPPPADEATAPAPHVHDAGSVRAPS